jgi:hypothetical protein
VSVGPDFVTFPCLEDEALPGNKARPQETRLAHTERSITVKNAIKIIFVSAVAMAIAAPAFAQSSSYGNRTGAKTHRGHPVAVKRGGNAFAMQSRFGSESDSNSPAQTGAGSLGYNQKLLQD